MATTATELGGFEDLPGTEGQEGKKKCKELRRKKVRGRTRAEKTKNRLSKKKVINDQINLSMRREMGRKKKSKVDGGPAEYKDTSVCV